MDLVTQTQTSLDSVQVLPIGPPISVPSSDRTWKEIQLLEGSESEKSWCLEKWGCCALEPWWHFFWESLEKPWQILTSYSWAILHASENVMPGLTTAPGQEAEVLWSKCIAHKLYDLVWGPWAQVLLSSVLWFECKTPPKAFCVWILALQMVALFWPVVGPLGMM